MKFTTVTTDVYSTICGEAYRLFIDNELLTERTFIWDPNLEYVKEHIIVQAEQGSIHTVSVQSVNNLPCFSLKNVTVDGVKTERTFRV